MDEERIVNKITRIEATLALHVSHQTEMRTLIATILTSPGQYTTERISKAFDAIVLKQQRESLALCETLMDVAPIEEDADIRGTLTELGLMPEVEADEGEYLDPKQTQFEFPELEDIEPDDIDLFDEEDKL